MSSPISFPSSEKNGPTVCKEPWAMFFDSDSNAQPLLWSVSFVPNKGNTTVDISKASRVRDAEIKSILLYIRCTQKTQDAIQVNEMSPHQTLSLVTTQISTSLNYRGLILILKKEDRH